MSRLIIETPRCCIESILYFGAKVGKRFFKYDIWGRKEPGGTNTIFSENTSRRDSDLGFLYYIREGFLCLASQLHTGNEFGGKWHSGRLLTHYSPWHPGYIMNSVEKDGGGCKILTHHFLLQPGKGPYISREFLPWSQTFPGKPLWSKTEKKTQKK